MKTYNETVHPKVTSMLQTGHDPSLTVDCPKPPGEIFYNNEFDCGTDGWTFNPNYNAEITDNGDGTVHLKALSKYGSIVPKYYPKESGTWIIEVSVKNQSSANGKWGKISIRNPQNQWDTVEFGSMDDGIYTNEYSGVIADINIGANNDTSYECDFEYISMKVV
jgi:hypothetical protein